VEEDSFVVHFVELRRHHSFIYFEVDHIGIAVELITARITAVHIQTIIFIVYLCGVLGLVVFR
jgi:hypothetical protein